MSTLLTLCQNVFRDAGLTGSVATVASQTGVKEVVVKKVIEADYAIQGKFHNWKFLWKTWTKTLTPGTADYNPPADIGEFVTETNAALIDGDAISVFEYERVRSMAASTATGTPSAMILMPDGTVRMYPEPTAANVLTAEYYRAPARMSAADASESPIPEKFERAIETLAIATVCAFNEDWENYKLFMQRHAEEMVKLEASQLSGHISRSSGGTEDNAVRAE